jgi:hypothetical protein
VCLEHVLLPNLFLRLHRFELAHENGRFSIEAPIQTAADESWAFPWAVAAKHCCAPMNSSVCPGLMTRRLITVTDCIRPACPTVSGPGNNLPRRSRCGLHRFAPTRYGGANRALTTTERIGLRIERLTENVGALGVQLTREELDEIERRSPKGAVAGERYHGSDAAFLNV